MSGPPTVKQPFLPEYRSFKTLDDDFLAQLNSMYADLARYMNARVIGLYDLIQVNTGEKWFDDNPGVDGIQRRFSYRKVLFEENFTSPILHELTGVTAFTDYRIMATGNDGYFYKGPSPDISMKVNSTQVELVNNTGTNLTNLIIVVEYLLN